MELKSVRINLMDDFSNEILWLYTLEFLCFYGYSISVHPFLIYNKETNKLKGFRFNCCGKTLGSLKLKIPAVVYITFSAEGQINFKTNAVIVYEDKIIRLGEITENEIKRFMKLIKVPKIEKIETAELIPELNQLPNAKLYLSVIKFLSGNNFDNPMKIQSMLSFANEIHFETYTILKSTNKRIKKLISDGIIL